MSHRHSILIIADHASNFIPEEYDVDFGFFDDEIAKNRILGS